MIFARTMRARRLRLTTGFFGWLEGTLKRLVQKLGIDVRLRTLLRNRVRSGG